MDNNTEFKRLNFFRGFFTAARDWTAEQDYHRRKLQLHNRALHTPGILHGLEVEPGSSGGLAVEVTPGAALDSAGREVLLATRSQPVGLPANDSGVERWVTVAIRYAEVMDDFVSYEESPEFNNFTRVAERPQLEVLEAPPVDGSAEVLARVRIDAGATTIATGDIDQGEGIGRRWAGTVRRSTREVVPDEQRQRLLLAMRDTRESFDELARRFPVAAAGDTRFAALAAELMVALAGELYPEQLPAAFQALADVELDVEQEVGETYPVLEATEYLAYRQAVAALHADLSSSAEVEVLLARQELVAEAARELAQVPPPPPVADFNVGATEIRVRATDGTATVRLDASPSSPSPGGGRITTYRWNLLPTF